MAIELSLTRTDLIEAVEACRTKRQRLETRLKNQKKYSLIPRVEAQVERLRRAEERLREAAEAMT
jgi:hypothetical protein